MILPGSRYAQAPVAVLQAADGTSRKVIQVSPQQAPYGFAFVSYQVKQGDTVQSLAAAFLGDPGQWWQIADANPEYPLYDDRSAPQPGTVIRIPSTGS